MNVTHIEIPIYEMTICLVLDDWQAANGAFNLGLTDEDLEGQGWTLIDEKSDHFVYVLLKSKYKSCLFHELFHVMSAIIKHTGIKPDPDNDEALAHLQEFVGKQISDFIGYGNITKS